ncbi:MAG: ATP-grasp domain-containing protein [Methylococcaceae bacterium]
MFNSNYLLIIATSARYLAFSATINGFKPLVIDIFADVDTQNYSFEYQQIKSLALENLIPAVDYFIKRYQVKQCLYGSGFENFIESLYYLDKHFVLLGNSPATFQAVQNKQAFFNLLIKLNINHPKTYFTAPDNSNNYLIKPFVNQGGVGVSYYTNQQNINAFYWQELQAGLNHSVLFLANGDEFQVIGFNTQWTINLGTGHEFIFSGIINYARLTPQHKNLIIDWLKKLVPALKLIGLNSLDFIVDNQQCYCLEINPRIPASVQLYDNSLLIAHINGSLHYKQSTENYQAYQIIYAPRDIIIPDTIDWTGYVDIPQVGSDCRAGQPICSMIASSSAAKSTLAQLKQQQHTLFSQLFRGSSWQTQQASINYPNI